MEKAGRWENDVTQHFHIVGSKSIKMEEAGRWEDDVTLPNSYNFVRMF